MAQAQTISNQKQRDSSESKQGRICKNNISPTPVSRAHIHIQDHVGTENQGEKKSGKIERKQWGVNNQPDTRLSENLQNMGIWEMGLKTTEFIQRPFSAPVSTPSGYVILGSNPNPAVSVSVLRNVSKSKFSRMSGFSRALKSRLKVEGWVQD
jgi:hypothetical protein